MTTTITGQCWWHMAVEAERCPNAAKWRTSPALIATSDETARSFLSACVWCDDHKHDDDVLIEEQNQ